MGITSAHNTQAVTPSSDAGNSLVIGSDRLPYVPPPVGGGGAASTPLNITKTGDWRTNPDLILVPPRNYQINGVVTVSTGKWIDSFKYSENNILVGPSILTLSFDDLEGIAGAFDTTFLANITSISLPNLRAIGGDFLPPGYPEQIIPALHTLSAPVLKYIGGNIYIRLAEWLTALSVASVECVKGSVYLSTLGLLATLDFSELSDVGASIQLESMPSLNMLNIPNLSRVSNNLTVTAMAALTTIEAPALSIVGAITLRTMALLNTVSFSALTSCGGAFSMTSGTAALANLTFGTTSTLKSVAGNVTITSAALTQSSVDGVLEVLASLDGTNGTTAFSSPRTVTLTGTSAPPSAAGLASKAILVSRGVTVTHK